MITAPGAPLEHSGIVWGPWAGKSSDLADAFSLGNPPIELGEVIVDVVYPILQAINYYYPVPEEITDLLNTDIPFLDMTISEFLDIPPALDFLMVKIPGVLQDIEDIVGSGAAGTRHNRLKQL